MKNYVNSHIEQVKSFCSTIGISFDKLMSCPKCYTMTTMIFQSYNQPIADKGLLIENPAKILLKITRSNDNLIFEPTEEIKLLH